jgi:hypothetical protein
VGFISETVGTLEGIRKKDRGAYFAGRRTKTEFNESLNLTPDGRTHVRITLGPDHSQHPGLHGLLSDTLLEAVDLGFRLLSAPRIGMPRPAEFLTEDGSPRADLFADNGSPEEFHRRLETFSEVVEAIERKGVGRSIAITLSEKIRSRVGSPVRPWFEYLDQPENDAEAKAIATAIAEWADGDAAASHIAYGNDVFCTEDVGKSAGCSILNATHRAWLTETYDVRFANLEELAAKVSVSLSA